MTHSSLYLTGQRVGDYRLLRHLGAGGFADVYLAEPLYEEGQQVATKLLTHLMDNTDGLHAFTTFVQEARMIHLKHPHIVPVRDFGISREGIPYLVMEYVSGGTLRDRHPKGIPVPLPTVIGYIRPMVAALQYLHDHRLFHCDVKPENTLLLADFSIVTVAHTTRSLLLDEQMGALSRIWPLSSSVTYAVYAPMKRLPMWKRLNSAFVNSMPLSSLMLRLRRFSMLRDIGQLACIVPSLGEPCGYCVKNGTFQL